MSMATARIVPPRSTKSGACNQKWGAIPQINPRKHQNHSTRPIIHDAKAGSPLFRQNYTDRKMIFTLWNLFPVIGVFPSITPSKCAFTWSHHVWSKQTKSFGFSWPTVHQSIMEPVPMTNQDFSSDSLKITCICISASEPVKYSR